MNEGKSIVIGVPKETFPGETRVGLVPGVLVLVKPLGGEVIVALGGDGTNRRIARTWPDVLLIPLSTGTNNVFPVMAEATSAAVLIFCMPPSLMLTSMSQALPQRRHTESFFS